MKKIFVSSVVGLGLLLPSIGLQAQVITIGGSVLGRPVAITGRTSVRFNQLPANVQQIIRSQAGGGVVAGVERGNILWPGIPRDFSAIRRGSDASIYIERICAQR